MQCHRHSRPGTVPGPGPGAGPRRSWPRSRRGTWSGRTGRRLLPGRLGPQGLLDACMVDPLPDLLLHPHPAPAGAAAEATLVVPLDLYQLGAGNRLHHRTWSIVDVVPAAQVARVVVGELTLHRPGGFEPALRYQLREQLSS